MQILEKRRECSGLFDRAEVFAYEVFDEGELERPGLIDDPVHERWDCRLAGELRRAPATLARHQLESALHRLDDHRLQDATLTNRARQREQRCVVEPLARLLRVGPDLFQRDVAQPRAGGRVGLGARPDRIFSARCERVVDM